MPLDGTRLGITTIEIRIYGCDKVSADSFSFYLCTMMYKRDLKTTVSTIDLFDYLRCTWQVYPTPLGLYITVYGSIICAVLLRPCKVSCISDLVWMLTPISELVPLDVRLSRPRCRLCHLQTLSKTYSSESRSMTSHQLFRNFYASPVLQTEQERSA